MGRKNVKTFRLLDDASLATSFNSDSIDIEQLDNLVFQLFVTTTDSQGTFKIQVSPDKSVWDDLTLGGGVPTVAAANVIHSISLNQMPFKHVRLVYTSIVAGTGTVDVWVTEKQIGG